MVVWDMDGDKCELRGDVERALRVLGLGYRFIHAFHGAALSRYKFCVPAYPGYAITPEGRLALEICDEGHEYDCKTGDRRVRD
jgi:hypothetical protein